MIRQPREPLSDEERALAEQLPRLHGRSEPDPWLDARILGAARAAVALPAALRPRIRWIGPMAVAASLSLAVGLAWRLQPPVAVGEDAAPATVVVTDLPEAGIMAPPASPAQPSAAAVSPPTSSPGQARPARQRPAPETGAGLPPYAAPIPAPPPPAPPASPATSSVAAAERAAATDMGAASAVAPSSSQGMAKAARTSETAREPAPVSAPAPRAPANEAAMGADAAAASPQRSLADNPGQEVPPATADSPEVRDAWLQRIGELLQQGRSEDAKASLAEFRRRYPDAPLPPDLRALEP